MSYHSASIDIDSALSKTLDQFSLGVPSKLLEAIQYSLLGPGKRIRPRLALACGSMAGLPLDVATHVALALEMIHCYTLIHDDLPCMDNDDYRRGRPANHKQFGEAMALLAGDALIGLATEVIIEAQNFVEPQNLVIGMKRFAWAIGPRGVVGGQAAEMQLNTNSTIGDLREMHAKKTGALFIASLLIPADFAGISMATTKGKAIEEFAKQLGLAFQIADDLEDINQDVARSGGTPAPQNVLYYLPEDDVRLLTISGLEKAKRQLTLAWDRGSETLELIADEVIKRLKLTEAV